MQIFREAVARATAAFGIRADGLDPLDVEFMKRVGARMETPDPDDAQGASASGRRSSNRDASA